MPAVKHVDAQGGPDPEAELGSDSAAVDAALEEWRHKAADVLLIAASVVHLPVLSLLMLGHGAPMAWWLRDTTLPLYLVLVAVALFRTVNYRTRLLVFFVAIYLAVDIASFANLRGPYSQLGLVTLPVLVLVFLGNRAAAVAIGTSATIFLSAVFLRVRPELTHRLGFDSSYAPTPTAQITAFTVWLMALIVPLGRFGQFLLISLAAQYRAKAALEREVVERTAAQSKVEREMRERQRLEREIAEIGDGERCRLGQELHDGACQQFTAALLHCQVLRRRLQSGEVLFDHDFQAVSSLLSEGIGEARNIARGLCPLDPDPEALALALRVQTKRIQEMGSVRCEFVAAGDVRVPDPAIAQHLYRIAQEAVSNAVRHAHASRIAVELRRSDSDLILLVEDDGAGLPHELPIGGMGLRTMAYRAQIMDGELTVASVPGAGTCITCRMPFPAEILAAGHHT